MKKNIIILAFLGILLSFIPSCREDEVVYMSESERVTYPLVGSEIQGVYLLNEGNMGMNKASIDYFDYTSGYYIRDVYSEANPNVVKELGDVGNDLQIYGNKLYAVINCSDYVEVMDVKTAKHIGEISVPNCRYMIFNEGKAYISSYAGPVAVDPNAGKGFVAEIDTTTLELKRKVIVGYQPEEMVIHNNKLYVANSGGYRVPNYDRTVSVIDLTTFQVMKTIDVGINLHRMAIDGNGDIYVSSRGDYLTTHSALYIINSATDEVKQKLEIPISEMCVNGDSLYYYSVEWSHNSGGNAVTYGILNTNTKTVVSDKVIKDGSDKDIIIPYGLRVNPETKEFFVTDAQDYVVTGMVYCYSPQGNLQWKVKAGNIPAHFAFVYK